MRMAREKVKIDADNFIESVREASVPTYHTARNHAEEATPKAKPLKKVDDDGPYKIVDDSIEAKYSSLNMTETEIDFIKTYVVNPNFRQINKKGKQIVIREQHRQMIQNILSMVNEEANMATYIDNVLTQHFKEYYSTIVGIYQKCPPKF